MGYGGVITRRQIIMDRHARERGVGWLWIAAMAGSLVVGIAASAEDVVVTQNQTFRGKVKSADPSGITIEITDPQGRLNMITVPRSMVVRVTVEPPPSVIRGIEAYEKGNMKEAQLNLGKLMLQYQGLDVDWASKGMIYFACASLVAGDYEKAEKAFNVFITSYPDHPLAQDAEVGLGEIALVKKNYDAALAKFRELAEPYDKQLKPPKNQVLVAAKIYLGIGKCLEGQSNPTDALNAYLRVIALYPAEKYYPEALYRGAMIYAGLHQPEKAEALLSELISDYPSSEFVPKAVEEKKTLIARRGGAEASGTGSKPATP